MPSDLNGWLAGLGSQQVSVKLPKFTFTTQFDLTPQLQSLGMTSAFSNSANFSGLTNPSTLKISDVVHKAYVSVDQAGTGGQQAGLDQLVQSRQGLLNRTESQKAAISNRIQ